VTTCTMVYAIPAPRTTKARCATTDLRVVTAGPLGIMPRPSVACLQRTQPLGHISLMISGQAGASVDYQQRSDYGIRRAAARLGYSATADGTALAIAS
jgi:hypothetical protein